MVRLVNPSSGWLRWVEVAAQRASELVRGDGNVDVSRVGGVEGTEIDDLAAYVGSFSVGHAAPAVAL